MDPREWTRRDVLRSAGGVGTAALAGCTGLLQRRSTQNPAVVEDRPDAVYVPTHVEGMEMIGMKEAGDRSVGLMYSYAHRFWTVTGQETNRAPPSGDVHLMAAVWDPDSGTVLPVGSGLTVMISRDGERVANRSPWTMLSQNMGFHYGDNFFLDGDGTYTVTVETGGLSLSRVSEFTDRFGESVTAEFEWEYSQSARDEIMFRTLEKAGETGAIDPMEMSMPLSFAPPAEELPGRIVGSGESGDARFVATVRSGDEGEYLAVSPRTPHNRYVLPMMSLSATLTRDGKSVYDDVLSSAIGPDLGYHYGATVDSVESGDELTVTVDAPPQASRHEGYETAFLNMSDVSITVE